MKETSKACVIDVKFRWVSNYRYPKFCKKLDTHIIVCQFCDNLAHGEPITINNFVIDTIIRLTVVPFHHFTILCF